MVELMVSLVLVSLITLASLALYNVAASTYKTTDDNQQLQDNARFIFEVFSQAVRQAGLQDSDQHTKFITADPSLTLLAPAPDRSPFLLAPSQAPLFGYNNATVASTGNVNDFGTHDTGGATINYSDVFGVRYFGSSRLNSDPIDVGTADGSIIDCRGIAVRYPESSGDIGLSLFRIALGSANEPELQCINRERALAWNIVRGVETLQVMYAVNSTAGVDTTPNRWLNAKQVSDAALWPKVRMIRVGMVLRGSIGSAQVQAAALYPLGQEFSSISGTPSTEQGMTFVPPNDNRLRRAFAFNIAIRNTLD